MRLNRLLYVLRLEAAAVATFNRLGKQERAVYIAANPQSAFAKDKKQPGGTELFSLDKQGNKVDAHLHGPILESPHGDSQSRKISRHLAERQGMSADVIDRLWPSSHKPSEENARREEGWWDLLTRRQQLLYVRQHPHSRMRNKIKALERKAQVAPVAPPKVEAPTPTKKKKDPKNVDEYFDSAPGKKYSIIPSRFRAPQIARSWDTYFKGVDPEQVIDSITPGLDITRVGIMTSEDDGVRLDLSNNEGMSITRIFQNIVGKKVVDHEFFRIPASGQGHGTAKKFLSNSFAMYERSGVDEVKLHANIDVGSYAWAKYGFVPNQESWDKLRGELGHKLLNLAMSDSDRMAVHSVLSNKDPHSIWLLSDCDIQASLKEGYDSGYTDKVGKLLLMNRHWRGAINLHDPLAMKRFHAYVGDSVTAPPEKEKQTVAPKRPVSRAVRQPRQ